jgi:hypothetical protein
MDPNDTRPSQRRNYASTAPHLHEMNLTPQRRNHTSAAPTPDELRRRQRRAARAGIIDLFCMTCA